MWKWTGFLYRPERMKVNVNDVMKGSMQVELNVTGVNRAKVRIWCAKQLIRLACWIINHDVTFKGNA